MKQKVAAFLAMALIGLFFTTAEQAKACGSDNPEAGNTCSLKKNGESTNGRALLLVAVLAGLAAVGLLGWTIRRERKQAKEAQNRVLEAKKRFDALCRMHEQQEQEILQIRQNLDDETTSYDMARMAVEEAAEEVDQARQAGFVTVTLQTQLEHIRSRLEGAKAEMDRHLYGDIAVICDGIRADAIEVNATAAFLPTTT